MNSKEVAKRIERIAESKGLSKAELARRIGSDRSTITRYYNGTRKITMEEIPKFANVLEVDSVELLIGNEKIEEIKNVYPLNEEKVRIPVLGKIACGDPIIAEQNVEYYITKYTDTLPKGDVVVYFSVFKYIRQLVDCTVFISVFISKCILL